jgi:hypothetical protein
VQPVKFDGRILEHSLVGYRIRTEASNQAEPAAANLVVTTSSGHFQWCANPFCNTDIEPLNHGRWRRSQRRFCSDPWKYDYHALKRVKVLLNRVGMAEFQRLFDESDY